MNPNYVIKEPFFEYGPKCYMYGDVLLEIAKGLDELSEKYDVDVILDVPDTEIYNIAKNTKRIHVYAQHMDGIPVGRGMGRTLPEAVKAAGAVGVMLNHAEHKLTLEEIKAAIARADEVGLATMVCADSVEEVKQIAALAPNILVAEPTELIGTGKTADKEYVDEVIRCIREINPAIKPFPSAGISKGEDCYNMIKAGSSASGCSSAIAKAEKPLALAEEMIAAVRRAWDELHGDEVKA
jgi:triosephosphate isomerase